MAKIITVNDKMQKGYRYKLTEPTGKNFSPDFKPELNEVKIGYTFFARTCWGQSYNRSTKLLMLSYAFDHVHRVVFHVGANNIRSQKAMEKLGAIKEGEEEVAYYGEATRLNFVYLIESSFKS